MLFFDIPLSYYYINFNSSIICCLSFGDTYLSFAISLLALFWGMSLEFNSLDFLEFNSVEELVILSAILSPIKCIVPSAVSRIALFEAVFIASVADFLALPTSF